MKIELIEKSNDKLSFIVKEINTAIANAIRRSVAEIPILAIDSVEFYKNDSVLYDEIIAHRLGLIPLRATSPFVERESCSCKGKGCIKCSATLKLKAQGPKMVYASELKAKGLEVVHPKMPIVLLAADQELELVAEARLGKAIEHAKFSPGLIWFNALPIIKELKEGKKTIELSSEQLEAIKQGKSPLIPDLLDEVVECNDRLLHIKASDTDFIFFIESWGQLKPEKIFVEALKVLNSNLELLEKTLKLL